MEPPILVAVCDDARAVKTFLRHVLVEHGDMRPSPPPATT
jgi:hypothetical protein